MNLTQPIQCAHHDRSYPVRILATNLRGKFPIVAAVDVGPREEVYLFAADGAGQNDNYRLYNGGAGLEDPSHG